MPKDTTDDKRPDGQPRRPPNRFFVYRAEKTALHKALNPHDHQVDISKIIAERWKHETPEVIAHYEQKAQARKAEHKLKYPDYKYQPKSKQQKLAEREEQKAKRPAKKTRAGSTSSPAPSSVAATPVHTPTVLPYPLVQSAVPPPAFLPQPNHPMYYPHLRYGDAGPTPPLSAAPTPTDVDTDEQPDTPNNASPSTSASGKLADASYYSTSIQNPRPQYPAAAAQNLLAPVDSEPSPSSTPGYGFQWMTTSGGPSSDQFNWDAVNAAASPVSQPESFPQENMSFDGPSLAAGLEIPENIWAYLNVPASVNDPNSLGAAASSLYCLSDFAPGHELEITPGNTELSNLAHLFGQDVSAPMDPFSPALNPSFTPSLSQNDFTQLPLFTDNTTPSSQVMPLMSFASYNTADYLEPLDTSIQGSSRQVSYTNAPSAAAQPSASGASSSPYVPPPGASLAGTRRVAGSWKIPRNFDA